MKDLLAGLARSFVLLALLAAFAAALLFVPAVHGQDRATYAQRQLIALLSRVSFNEGGGSYPDLGLIWQVTREHGDTARERASWLAGHSSCVSGRLPDSVAYRRPGNCRWSRNLEPHGRQPRGWMPGDDGDWRVTRPHWLRHVPRVRAFVRGEDTYEPCPGQHPQSWDGARWREEVLERGYRILECSVPYVTEPGVEGLHNLAVTRERPDGA